MDLGVQAWLFFRLSMVALPQQQSREHALALQLSPLAPLRYQHEQHEPRESCELLLSFVLLQHPETYSKQELAPVSRHCSFHSKREFCRR